MGTSFWLFQAAKFAALAAVAWATGRVAERGWLRVNYTRKVNHFAISFLPDYLSRFFVLEATRSSVVVGALVSLSWFGLLARPIRSRVPALATMFAAIDRPEDRPFTLLWFVTQYAAGIAVLIPFYLWFQHTGAPQLVLLPLLINNVGDGLAEPVGVRFGRHPYTTRALFTRRTYTRTLEGSATVLVCGLVLAAWFTPGLSAAQAVALVAVVPAVMALAEAFSPHTWDAPFLLLAGETAVALIAALVP